jgi:hypothetical protein
MKQKKAKQQQQQQEQQQQEQQQQIKPDDKQDKPAISNLLSKITSFRTVVGPDQDDGTKAEQQQADTTSPGLGIMDDLKRNASMWMSNVKYYTVWHDKFVAPEDILTEEKLSLSQTTSVAKQGSVKQSRAGSATPLSHGLDEHNSE